MSYMSIAPAKEKYPFLLDPRWESQLSATAEGKECYQFLKESKVLYPIIGFAAQDHTAEHLQTGLQFAPDGHPLLRVEGALVRWSDFIERFELTSWGAVHKRGSNEVWSYLNSQRGFIPLARYDWKQAIPVHRLAKSEYDALLAHAQGFYPSVDENKRAILQIVTNHEPGSSNTRPTIWNNARCPNHTSIRMITEDGSVYAFGLEKDGRYETKVPIRMDSITAPASLTLLDYEDFRTNKTDQLITSIPITMESANEVMQEMARVQRHIRFTSMHQNCASVAAGFAEMAGIEMPERRTIPYFLLCAMIPDLRNLPLIGPVIRKVSEVVTYILSTIWSYTPSPIRWLITFAVTAVFFIPKKIFIVFFNTLLLLGSLSYQGDLPEGFVEEPLTSDLRPKSYSCLVRSFWDLFSDDVGSIFHSQFLINWQMEQKTTRRHEHTDKPLLRVLPELGTKV